MNQKEFNNEQTFQSLLTTAQNKQLGYRFILDSLKRDKRNLNLKQATQIANTLDLAIDRILYYALDLNILNVTTKEKKIILKSRKNDST